MKSCFMLRGLSKADMEFKFEKILLTKIRMIGGMELSWLIELHLTWSCSHLKLAAVPLESYCTHIVRGVLLTLAYGAETPSVSQSAVWVLNSVFKVGQKDAT